MKKYCLFFVCLLVMNILLSGCGTKVKQSMIKSERRVQKLLQETKSDGTIDLSEGPKLKYDKQMGPKDLNFEFKIINPY